MQLYLWFCRTNIREPHVAHVTHHGGPTKWLIWTVHFLQEYVPEHCGVAPKLSWEMEQQLVHSHTTAKSDIYRWFPFNPFHSFSLSLILILILLHTLLNINIPQPPNTCRYYFDFLLNYYSLSSFFSFFCKFIYLDWWLEKVYFCNDIWVINCALSDKTSKCTHRVYGCICVCMLSVRLVFFFFFCE